MTPEEISIAELKYFIELEKNDPVEYKRLCDKYDLEAEIETANERIANSPNPKLFLSKALVELLPHHVRAKN